MPLNQQGKKEVTVGTGAKDPESQGQIGMLLNKGDKKDYVWNTEDPIVSQHYYALQFRSMENYNNPTQAGLQMAQNLEKCTFGSPYQ